MTYFEQIETQGIIIKDKQGKERMLIGFDSDDGVGARITILDESGIPRLHMGIPTNGNPLIVFDDKRSISRIRIALDDDDDGLIAIGEDLDKARGSAIFMGLNDDQTIFRMTDNIRNQDSGISLGVSDRISYVMAFDQGGEVKAGFSVAQDGTGIDITNSNQNVLKEIGSLLKPFIGSIVNTIKD